MIRRLCSLRSAVTLALAGLLAVAAACDRPDPRWNVIVVSVDTLNRSALRAFDPEAQALPAIDAFVSQGIAFSRAHTTASWTLPAHTSLFTGRYPNRHGVVRIQQSLPDVLPVLPEILLESGFETVAFTDGALLDPEFGHSRGFQLYDGQRQDPSLRPIDALPRAGLPARNHGAAVFDRAAAYLRQRPRDAPPFFLFLHTFAVHDYFQLYADVVPAPAGLVNPPHGLDCLLGEMRCSAEQWSWLRARYDAGVRAVDAAFGELMTTLEHQGLAENTVVLLMADHGEGFDPARQRIHHGGRVHADVIRIPMVWRVPGLTGGRDERLTSLVDVMPTLLGLLGLAIEADVDGRPLFGDSQGAQDPTDRPVHAMEYSYTWEDGKRIYRPRDEPIAFAYIADDSWYIQGVDGEELYGFGEDPEQRQNLAGSSDALERLGELAAAAATWDAPDPLAPLIDEDLERHLRSLGYVQ